MTGPEHQQQAEKLLETADHWMNDDMPTTERLARRTADIAAAQAHATLALAAATALPNASEMPPTDCDAWRKVASGAAS